MKGGFHLDFQKILDGMSWFGDKINEAIWGLMYHFASALITDAFEYVVKFSMIETDPNKFFSYDSYLTQMQAISLALLCLAIAWEGVKYQSGALGEEVTITTLVTRSGMAAISIFFLPVLLTKFFLKISNFAVQMIVAEGIKIIPGEIGPFDILLNPKKLSAIIIILFLILAIAFVALSIVAGMRYVELIILIMLAPLAAVSIVRETELLDVWLRETITVVFTQPVQIFLLALLMNVVAKMNDPFGVFTVAIACLVLMITGPQVLRKFLYNTGTGSAGVKAIGGAGRMAAFKAIGKGALR